MKLCAICKIEKPLDQFTTTNKGRPHSYCNPCKSEKQKTWVENNRERANYLAFRARLKKYGITAEEYERLKAMGCAICGVYSQRLVIDHCHKTGPVRGLLCSNCNTGLGMFADDPARLRAAARYLEETRDAVSV